MYIPSTHEKSQIPILRILSEKGSTAHRLGLRNLRLGNGASWLRRGTCLTVHPGFAAQLAGRTITMLSALLAADRDVARLDRGTTRRENVTDTSPAC